MTTGDYHRGVKAVGVKQLKARLSEFLRLVKSGETILITERDEVVAELRPSVRQPIPAESTQGVLEALAESGRVTLPSRSKDGWTWSVRGLGLPPGTAAKILDDLRDDR